MKSHIPKSAYEEQLRPIIKEQLSNARASGLAVGAKSISKVIYDIATAKKGTSKEKLKEIIDFCEVGLKIKDNPESVKKEDGND